MNRYFLLHPDNRFYTICALEARLEFTYLPQIAFESAQDRIDVQSRGEKKRTNNEVSAQSQTLGKQLIKKIEADTLPAVSIRWINERVGYGLFAEEDLEEGSYAGEYTGIVRKNDRRHFEPLNNYCFEYPVPDEIGRSFVIDATQGNLTRFINHSFSPNLKPFHVFHDDFYHLIFLAVCPIKKGEQLSFDYGINYWYIREPPQEF